MNYSIHSVPERLAWKSNVKPDTGCYIFDGCRLRGGYGHIRHQGRLALVHRLAYEIFVGPIPPGLDVLHDCPGGDNPSCWNPAHLWVGDAGDNMQDASRKGRLPRGEQRQTSKLDASRVREIRSLFDRTTLAEIARQYGVSPSTIRDIHNGMNWKHVTT